MRMVLVIILNMAMIEVMFTLMVLSPEFIFNLPTFIVIIYCVEKNKISTDGGDDDDDGVADDALGVAFRSGGGKH